MSTKQSDIPFVDWDNQASPFYTDRHKRWRALVRKFVSERVEPHINKWEQQRSIPLSLYEECYKLGVYSARYPKEYDGTPFEGKPWDNFMTIILFDELARACAGGLFPSLFIHTLSIPPVLHFGNEYQKQMFREVVRAEKIAALAISETGFGSDVANLETTARRDGDYFIVNGNKKWISNGMKAHYFLTAVRTGGPGAKGISFLIIPRSEGVTTFRINTQGHWTSETTQVYFKDVKVPVKNLIGKENEGFKYIMFNFNQERYGIAIQAAATARMCLVEAVQYARERVVFKQPLINSQVIRHKCAEMARKILSTYALMEKIASQMNADPLGEKDPDIPTNVALFKVQATKTCEFCAREASQIFGGKSYVLGSKIDRMYRDVRAYAIYGGSEEILLDVATRLAKL